uniref:hypothetical protein n=1 Tax=Bacillus pumilus TaxID=1408 RepID=UPI001C92ED96
CKETAGCKIKRKRDWSKCGNEIGIEDGDFNERKKMFAGGCLLYLWMNRWLRGCFGIWECV